MKYVLISCHDPFKAVPDVDYLTDNILEEVSVLKRTICGADKNAW